MSFLYDEKLALKTAKTRKILIIIYIIASTIVLITEVALLIYHATNYYNYIGIKGVKTAVLTIGGVFAGASCIYFCMPFANVNNYYKFVNDAIKGAKSKTEVTVISVDKTLTLKYGVECYKLNVLEWSEQDEEYIRRTVLIDEQKNDLEFNGGEILKIETYSNVLTAYMKVTK